MTALSFTCITKKENTVRTNVTPLYSQNMFFAVVLPLHQTGEDAGLCESHFSIPNTQQVTDASFRILKEGDSCGSGSYLHTTPLHSPTDSTHPGSCDACHPTPQHNPDPPPQKRADQPSLIQTSVPLQAQKSWQSLRKGSSFPRQFQRKPQLV